MEQVEMDQQREEDEPIVKAATAMTARDVPTMKRILRLIL